METASAVSLALSVLVLLVAIVRWPKVAGMTWVVALCAMVVVWCWSAWTYERGELSTRENAVWLAAVSLTVGGAYLFGRRALGRHGPPDWRHFPLLLEPLAVLLSGLVAPGWWADAFSDDERDLGWAFLLHSLYCVALILLAAGLVLRRYERSHPPLKWWLGGIVASAAAGVALQLTQTDGMPFAAVGVALFVALAYPELTADPLTDVDERDIDTVTGVLDRGALDRMLAAAVDRAESRHLPLTVIYVDFDKFKQVNDTYGHLMGDVVLRTVAERITRTVGAHARVGRFGGDEFVVVAPGLTLAEASALAQQVVAVCSVPVTHGDVTVPVSVSAGAAAYAGGGTDALIGAADKAMYYVKQAGGNASAAGI